MEARLPSATSPETAPMPDSGAVELSAASPLTVKALVFTCVRGAAATVAAGTPVSSVKNRVTKELVLRVKMLAGVLQGATVCPASDAAKPQM